MKIFRLIAVLVTAATALAGCSGSEDLSPNNLAITQVIDVRTAAEFNEGHISGAINIDVEALDFATNIAKLDAAGKYLVYCHSGRRSAIAAGKMSEIGLSVLDGGGIQSMLERGWTLGA